MNREISVEEAKKLLGKGGVTFVDVRTRHEYEEGHIPGAGHLDFYGAQFVHHLEGLDRTTSYIMVCLSGGRSGSAVSVMAELGFGDAKNLKGGILAWKGAGLPTIQE